MPSVGRSFLIYKIVVESYKYRPPVLGSLMWSPKNLCLRRDGVQGWLSGSFSDDAEQEL